MFRPILATVQHIHEAAGAASHEVAAHGAEAVHHMSFSQYILHSNIINMIFVAAFIVWVIKKANVVGILKSRQEQIAQNIAKAEEAKAQAQEVLKSAQDSVKGLDTQVAKILDDAKASAAAMSDKIQNDTLQKLDEISKNLQKTIEVEEKSAAEDVLQGLSKEAFEVASGKIKDALNDELHHKYIHNFIDSLDETKVK